MHSYFPQKMLGMDYITDHLFHRSKNSGHSSAQRDEASWHLE